MKKVVFCLLALCTSLEVLSATYDMTTTRPPCSSNWSVAGSTYTCNSGTITLASGDSIVSGGGGAITVIGQGGVTLGGSNTIGTTTATVNLQTTYGSLVANGSGNVIYGNVAATSGAINLTNTTVNGSVNTNGTVTLSGGSTTGNVTGRNGVTTTNNAAIGGNVLAATGTVSLSGGSVAGSVGSTCCTVSTTNTNIGNGVSSTNSTVTINGGTIAGPISSSGGSGVSISNATIASGSISSTQNISISNSTVGSPSSTVNVTSNNSVTLSSNTSVYGNVTSATNANALSIDGTSIVYGVCSSNSNSTANPVQYPRCVGAAPLAEWRMDEGNWSGASGEVLDTSGYGHHGRAAYANGSGPFPTTASASKAYTSGAQSTCNYGQFDTTTSPVINYTQVSLPSTPALPAAFTFTAWIRSTSVGTSGQRILVNDDAQNGWGFSLGDGASGSLRLFNRNINNSGSVSGSGSNPSCGVFCLDTNGVIANNTWYFVAAAVNTTSKTVTLYVINTAGTILSQTSSAFSGNWSNGSGIWSIGGETAASSEGTQASFHFKGNIDEVGVYSSALSSTALQAVRTRVRTCPPPAQVNHIRIEHDGEGLTCSPELVTVKACADANCSSLYTGSVTLNLAPGGAGFTFTGSTTTATVSRTTIGNATLTATDVNPGVIGVTRCFNGTAETCQMSFVDSGFLVNVPAHSAESEQTISIKAVKKANNAVACIPAFQSVNRAVKLRCGYVNPVAGAVTGQVPVRIITTLNTTALNASNSASNACDATGASINLDFDATGTATPKLKYADVGQMILTASHTLATADDMTGSSTFVVAPASFAFDNTVTTSPIKAGSTFSAKVSALNAIGNVTPSFSRESTPETVELKSVTTAAATAANSQLVGPSGGVSGTLTNGSKGLFARATCSPTSNGAVCSNTLAWTEVGDVNLVAAGKGATGYLGSGLTPWGVRAVRFIPAFFETALNPANVQGCGSFTYSGQPFRLTITARSQANTELASSIATTQNYTGAYAKAVTLGRDASAECTPTTTNFSNNTLLASDFSNGVAMTASVGNTSTPLPITYTQPLGAPVTVNVCAKETSADAVNSHGQAQAALLIRNGRLRMFNAFGSGRIALDMPVQTQYWTGNTWLQNTADSCTSLIAGNFFLAPGGLTSVSGPVSVTAGAGVIRLAAPMAGAAGSVDVAANLGTLGDDQSCLATHGGVPGRLPWLRSRNGSCAATYDRDPSARATFGIFSPEGQRVIHSREFF